MSTRTAAWLAWSTFVLAAACFSVGTGLLPLVPLADGAASASTFFIWVGHLFSLSWLSYSVVGALIAARRPENPVGWIFCAMGLAWELQKVARRYADSVFLVVSRPPTWLHSWVLPLLLNLWVIPYILLLLIFLLFPDGRLLSRRWRLIVWLAAADLVVGVLTSFTSSGPSWLRAAPLEHMLPAELAVPLVDVGQHVAGLLMLALFPVTVTAMVIRLRRSRGIERQQLNWFAYACVCFVVVFVPSYMTLVVSGSFEAGAPFSPAMLLGIPIALALTALPAAAGIAILRYHLYDIDLIINRTLVYSALTATIILIYMLVVSLLSMMFQRSASFLSSLLATGVVAVLFQPIRDRFQRGVNHLMYGDRDDPYAVLARLGQRLEATLAPEAVLPTIVETLAQALKLPYVAIALAATDDQRPTRNDRRLPRTAAASSDGSFVIAAVYGVAPPDPLRVPLVYQGEILGQLILAPRAGEILSAADRRLLADLARQIGVAVHAARLTTALQKARARLITAREEERRRLRRDLHDGLGPQLASQTLTLTAARQLLQHDPNTANELLADAIAHAQDAITDIRRLVYALRPPVLDDLGLVAALREQANQYRASGVQFIIDAPERLPPLPAAVEVACYGMVQEALTNVVRHAQARTCVITLQVSDALDLTICDDGRGLPAQRRAGVGLTSLHERASELGGHCTIEPAPGGGTCVRARLPFV